MTTIVRASVKTLYLSTLLRTQFRCSSCIAATKNGDIHKTTFDFENLIRNRCLSGNLGVEEALSYFNALVETQPLPSIWNFNHLFGSLSKMGNYSMVLSMYRIVSGLAGFQPQIGTLTIVMKCFCRIDRPDFGVSVLGVILKRGLKPNAHTLCTLLHALCSQGSMDVAVELFEELAGEEISCNEFAYAAIINGLCKAGETSKALEVLRQMYRDERARPDAGCFGPVIDALCKEGRVGEGFSLFGEMIGRRVSPNVVICNCLIQGLCKSGHWDDAEVFLVDMPRRYGVWPDVRTYNVIINALCKGEKYQEAISVFRLMLGRGLEPSVVTFSSVLSSLCRCGRLEEASQLLGSMVHFRVYPNIFMFTTMFDALCKEGRISEALKLTRVMTNRGINPDVFIYTSLIQGFCRLSRVDLGFCVLASMVKRGIHANARTLASLLHGLCIEGSMVSAMKFFQGIVENDHLSNEFLYAIFINGLCKVGETCRALELLRQMCDDTRTKPDAFCYNPIIDRFCKEQRVDEALSLFETMISRSVSSDVVSNSLIQGLCQSGHWEEKNGFQIDRLLKHGISPFVSTHVALDDSTGKERKTQEAISVHKSISKGVQPNIVTFNSLLSALCKCGQWSKASVLLSIMNSLEIFHDKFTLASMVDALCKERRIVEALNLMDEMANNGINSDVVVYNSLIHGLCSADQWLEAYKYFRKMEDRSIAPSVVTFTILADSLSKQRRTKEALKLLRNMVEKGLMPDHPIKKLLKRILTERGRHIYGKFPG